MAKYSFDSVIFDLDGVITQTARVHAQAWKEAFDEYLRLREKRDKEEFKEFTHDADYLPYVDGKPRYEGVKSFLESRGINIPYGDPGDSPDKETICGIGNKKNSRFREVLQRDGADVYASSVIFIKSLLKKGIKVGVASSSKNCKYILESAGIEGLFATRVDGVVSVELGLAGKPEGDIFVRAALNVGSRPEASVVVEDATSGVAAGRNGGFGLVLGVARKDNQADLLKEGADIVVEDLSRINIEKIEKWFHKKPKPLFKSWEQIERKESQKDVTINPCYNRSAKNALFGKKNLVFFLDYDGTLTPIVSRPELAVMPEDMREAVKKLCPKHTVAIVSGRLRANVEDLVKIKGLFYAGSHGFDIKGPEFSMIHQKAQEAIPIISEIIEKLEVKLGKIEGILVEKKKFSTAVHYRLADPGCLPEVKKAVDDIIEKYDTVRLLSGKKVFEILPNIDWDKGKAIRWIAQALKINWQEASVIYIGDDTTDEYAFRAVRTRGVGILVSEEDKESSADFQVASCDDVKKLFEHVLKAS